MTWTQLYDPFGNLAVSAAMAAIPIIALLAAIGLFRIATPIAAVLSALISIGVVTYCFGMPADLAWRASAFGAAYGLFPIGWLLLNILFLYRLSEQQGSIDLVRQSVARLSQDKRMQLLLIAFCFGAFLEGCAGFGAPVAITAAMLVALDFDPFKSACLALLANTAPVAFGSVGTPIIALATVTGLPLLELSAMVGRQLPFFSVLIPFWLIVAFAGWRAMLEVWQPIAITGITFAVLQFLVSNYHGPWLVDIVAAIGAAAALVLYLRNRPAHDGSDKPAISAPLHTDAPDDDKPELSPSLVRAWLPWIVLCGFVFVWGLPQTKALLDGLGRWNFAISGLHMRVLKGPPIVDASLAEPAIFNFNLLSATGTAIFLSAIVTAFLTRKNAAAFVRLYAFNVRQCSIALLTIASMLSIGTLTRFAGTDATLGLLFSEAGAFYPFVGTLLGWLGVAATGSDTASNVLFGNMQRTTAQRLGISPVLMAAANSSGGVMGKMVDVQSIVVASTSTGLFGRERTILRFVFFQSLILATLVALLVTAQAYVEPFTEMVP